jgi:hypothetical protein
MSKNCTKNQKNSEKVIHTRKCGNIEKNELYTKLSTLSTEKTIKI